MYSRGAQQSGSHKRECDAKIAHSKKTSTHTAQRNEKEAILVENDEENIKSQNPRIFNWIGSCIMVHWT